MVYASREETIAIAGTAHATQPTFSWYRQTILDTPSGSWDDFHPGYAVATISGSGGSGSGAGPFVGTNAGTAGLTDGTVWDVSARGIVQFTPSVSDYVSMTIECRTVAGADIPENGQSFRLVYSNTLLSGSDTWAQLLTYDGIIATQAITTADTSGVWTFNTSAPISGVTPIQIGIFYLCDENNSGFPTYGATPKWNCNIGIYDITMY